MVPVVDAEEGDGGEEIVGGAHGDAPGAADQAAAANAKDRAMAMQFIKDQPLGHLFLMRIMMEPTRVYMRKQFDRASEEWEFRQEAEHAAALFQGRPRQAARRISSVASGEDDRAFLLRLDAMRTPHGLWSVMSPSYRTVAMRARAFRMLSRMGCAFEKILGSRHRRTPYLTFLAPHSAATRERIRRLGATSPCMLDPWTKGLLEKHPQFDTPELFATLDLVAKLLRVDISHIESRHASIRRVLTVRSTQTWSLPIAELSALFMFITHRTHVRPSFLNKTKRGAERSMAKPQGRSARAKQPGTRGTLGKSRKQKKSEAPTQRVGFGGAWRKWMRKNEWRKGGVRRHRCCGCRVQTQ